MGKDKEKREGVVESFFDAVALTRDGHAPDELTGELQALVAAVEATGNGGSLTLALKVKRGKPQAGESTVVISADIRVVAPKTQHEDKIFFAKQDGTISRQPFAQGVIPFEKARSA